jgi:c(7)-type cytochrome triheme protein
VIRARHRDAAFGPCRVVRDSGKMSVMRTALLAVALVLLLCDPTPAQAPVKRRPLPFEYGRVVIANHSARAGLAPVVFEHWTHRARFTCRLCHVDVGFAMKAGATSITAADNARGDYCGACHDGKSLFDGRPIFRACATGSGDGDTARCDRCHASGKAPVKTDQDFAAFAAGLPKQRFGNGLDWERAESLGLMRPVDFLEGVSMKREALPTPGDLGFSPTVAGMPEIVFSHAKHTAWNGCEGCHPQLFVGVKRGATPLSMAEIAAGKYCGACHGTVAFPLIDCQRCHSRPVPQ